MTECVHAEQLEAETLLDDTVPVVEVPREAWRPFFADLVLELETGVAIPGTKSRDEFIYRL
jgi:hypothetical protein